MPTLTRKRESSQQIYVRVFLGTVLSLALDVKNQSMERWITITISTCLGSASVKARQRMDPRAWTSQTRPGDANYHERTACLKALPMFFYAASSSLAGLRISKTQLHASERGSLFVFPTTPLALITSMTWAGRSSLASNSC